MGIGANTTIFTAINALLFRSLHVERQSELVTVDFVGNAQGFPLQSYPNYRDLRDRNELIAIFLGTLELVRLGGISLQQSDNFGDIVIARTDKEIEDRKSVV